MLGFGEDDKKEVAAHDEKHEDKAGMAKVRSEDKKDEGKEMSLDEKAKKATEKLEKRAEAEKADTEHVLTGDSTSHHHLLREEPVQVVTCDETKVTRSMPFVETEVDHTRAVKVDGKK